MKVLYVHLTARQGKEHSPGVDLEMEEAEYDRLTTDYRLREAGGKGAGPQVKSYRCHAVTLHLDEVQDLIDGEAFPPDKRPL